MRKAAHHVAAATAQLARLELKSAQAYADLGLKALPKAGDVSSNGSLSLQRALLNTQGLALHLLADYDAAHEQLSAALSVQTVPNDDYADLAGLLSDLSANHLARGEVDDAEVPEAVGVHAEAVVQTIGGRDGRAAKRARVSARGPGRL